MVLYLRDVVVAAHWDAAGGRGLQRRVAVGVACGGFAWAWGGSSESGESHGEDLELHDSGMAEWKGWMWVLVFAAEVCWWKRMLISVLFSGSSACFLYTTVLGPTCSSFPIVEG